MRAYPIILLSHATHLLTACPRRTNIPLKNPAQPHPTPHSPAPPPALFLYIRMPNPQSFKNRKIFLRPRSTPPKTPLSSPPLPDSLPPSVLTPCSIRG